MQPDPPTPTNTHITHLGSFKSLCFFALLSCRLAVRIYSSLSHLPLLSYNRSYTSEPTHLSSPTTAHSSHLHQSLYCLTPYSILWLQFPLPVPLDHTGKSKYIFTLRLAGPLFSTGQRLSLIHLSCSKVWRLPLHKSRHFSMSCNVSPHSTVLIPSVILR